MRESQFQSEFISALRDEGFICLKQDPSLGKQKGVPDYLVIYRTRWMFLEFKASSRSPYRPLQKQWLERLSKWGFAETVYPENANVIRLKLERIKHDETQDGKIDG